MSTSKSILIGLVVVLILEAIMGASLASKQEDVNANIGKLWSVVDTAEAAISGVDNYMENYTADRQKLVEMQTSARKLIDEAKLTGDPEKLLEAFSQLNRIQVLVESPQAFTDLSEQQIAQMDNLVGQLSRVNKARQDVIDSQKDFNKMRIWSFPVGMMFFERYQIVGETFDPSTAAPRSNYGQ